jgi:hypothetical protein
VPGWFAPAALLLGLALGGAAVRHSRAVARPAVDLSLLRIPSFSMPTLAGNLFRAGAGAVPFLLPLSLQLAFGLSATDSGLVTFATALGAFAMKPLVKPVLRRFGFRSVLAANGVLAACGVAACALFSPSWPMIAIFAVLAAGGLSRSLQFTSLNTLPSPKCRRRSWPRRARCPARCSSFRSRSAWWSARSPSRQPAAERACAAGSSAISASPSWSRALWCWLRALRAPAAAGCRVAGFGHVAAAK